MRKSLGLILALALGQALSGAAAYSRYVAIGDSFTAGTQDGGLVEGFQKYSFPNIIAGSLQQKEFLQPLISAPGIPACLELVSLFPLVIKSKEGIGHPREQYFKREFDNLGIPGFSTHDLLYTTTDYGGLLDMIFRGAGTALDQAAKLDPDLVTLWIGTNDMLKTITQGKFIEGQTVVSLESFQSDYSQVVDFLALRTRARLVLVSIPEITDFPFVTAIPPYLTDPETGMPVLDDRQQKIYLIGLEATLTSGDFVTLNALGLIAQGWGIPVSQGGNGQPLPDEVVLNSREIERIRERIGEMNRFIKVTAEAKKVLYFDFNQILEKADQGELLVGGVALTPRFLGGGLFSLDGIHLTSLGNGIVAAEIIRGLNRQYEQDIPLPDLSALLLQQGSYTGLGWQRMFEKVGKIN